MKIIVTGKVADLSPIIDDWKKNPEGIQYQAQKRAIVVETDEKRGKDRNYLTVVAYGTPNPNKPEKDAIDYVREIKKGDPVSFEVLIGSPSLGAYKPDWKCRMPWSTCTLISIIENGTTGNETIAN